MRKSKVVIPPRTPESYSCIYRLSIHGDEVNVMWLDPFIDGCHEPIQEGWYSVSELPEWVKRRIATLMMIRPESPTEYVEGLGRRMSNDIFWLDAKGEYEP